MHFADYQTEGYYDELFLGPGQPRQGALPLIRRIEQLPEGDLKRRQLAAEAALILPPPTWWC